MKVTDEVFDDRLLVDALKELLKNFTIESTPIYFQEKTISFIRDDWQRLLELAEIGVKFLEQMRATAQRINAIDKELKEQRGEEQDVTPKPHFAIAEICIDPCDICLCRKCIRHCLDCPAETEDCKKCNDMCAESCVKGAVCEDQAYVDYCPAYNDGHGF